MSRKRPKKQRQLRDRQALPDDMRSIAHDPVDPYEREMLFSFKYLDAACESYSLDRCDRREHYVSQLLPRLCHLSRMTIKAFKGERSKALRSHPINWDEIKNHDGFGTIPETNEQLYAASQSDAYQFAVTANEYGRVAGFFIDNVFHVVWLDPDHLLYPDA